MEDRAALELHWSWWRVKGRVLLTHPCIARFSSDWGFPSEQTVPSTDCSSVDTRPAGKFPQGRHWHSWDLPRSCRGPTPHLCVLLRNVRFPWWDFWSRSFPSVRALLCLLQNRPLELPDQVYFLLVALLSVGLREPS